MKNLKIKELAKAAHTGLDLYIKEYGFDEIPLIALNTASFQKDYIGILKTENEHLRLQAYSTVEMMNRTIEAIENQKKIIKDLLELNK